MMKKILILFLLMGPFMHISNGGREEMKKQIPVLCYHNIYKNPVNEDILDISDATFNAQIKTLHDSGYHSILPGQLYKYLLGDSRLPDRSIMITFDDGHEQQFLNAKPILDKYGFKAIYFIMTVSIDKPHFLSKAQIKQLSVEGNEIGAHSWDHHAIINLPNKEKEIQISKPRQTLEKITGKPVESYAYPYGIWNDEAIQELKKSGYKLAFQLSKEQSEKDPLFTVRRIMVSGSWSPSGLLKEIRHWFR